MPIHEHHILAIPNETFKQPDSPHYQQALAVAHLLLTAKSVPSCTHAAYATLEQSYAQQGNSEHYALVETSDELPEPVVLAAARVSHDTLEPSCTHTWGITSKSGETSEDLPIKERYTMQLIEYIAKQAMTHHNSSVTFTVTDDTRPLYEQLAMHNAATMNGLVMHANTADIIQTITALNHQTDNVGP